MSKLVRRYLPALAALAGFILFIGLFTLWRAKALDALRFQAATMLFVIPPIFILLGLLDVWVPRERMVKFMGPGSGLKGTVLAFLLGSFAAGPLYGAFPFAAVLMKKGASLTNILIFIGAWSTTKIPMILFEISALGLRFALSRLAIDLVGIALIAWAIKAVLPKPEIDRIYAAASLLD